MERRPRWFAEESRYWFGNPSTPPPPAISAIDEDEIDRVWVFVRIAAPTWRDVWPNAARQEYSVNRMALEKLFHTTIEVIDPGAQRVIARATVPYWIVSALPGMRAAAYSVDREGVPHIEVFALEIRGLAR